LNVDLQTVVIDWPTMRSVQKSFLFSGLPDLDVPQDNSFVVSLMKFARENRINYILSGTNFATEGIMPQSWGYGNLDTRFIKDVIKKHSNDKIDFSKFPNFSILELISSHLIIKKINLLDYFDYSKSKALSELEELYG